MKTMTNGRDAALHAFLSKEKDAILKGWLKDMHESDLVKGDTLGRERLDDQCAEFLMCFIEAYGADNGRDLGSSAWETVRELVMNLARSRAALGFSPSETAHFVFSLKKAMLERFERHFGREHEDVLRETARFYDVLQEMAVITFESYSRSREELIRRQAESILELSCPIIKIWERILLCVVIGTVDTLRVKQLLESVLAGIRSQDARVVILDITGVAVIDTAVLKNLFTIMRGVRLMGAHAVLTGVSPAVAATVAKLQVDMAFFNTQGTLRGGLLEAYKLLNIKVS